MRRNELLVIALSLFCGLLLVSSRAQAQTVGSDGAQTSAAATASSDIFVRALYRHMPVLRYDTGEDFFPVRVESITNNVGNKLLRANGATIAERERGGRGLNAGYLRGISKHTYPNGDAILESDKLDERGDDVDEYMRDARQFQSSRVYGDRIYGRVVRLRDREGRTTGAWLQYWFFYYYNNFPGQVVDTGDHEGDWEMIQVKVDAQGKPLSAVYAHHNSASKCAWTGLRRSGSRPIVFVARGSHASYPRTGQHGQDVFNDGEQRRTVRRLIRVGTNSPQWLNWPGKWGSSGSPQGPKFQGDKWSDPEAFFAGADADDECRAH
jgi:hypothetical protein